MGARAELALESIRFGYGVGDWELRVSRLHFGGEAVCGIVGPNGSGKSTLLKIAAGLERPRHGEARLNGRPVQRMRRREVALELGYMPQESPATFDYEVGQVVAMGRHAHGGGLEPEKAEDVAAVARALDAVKLEPFRRRRLSQLSGGERRRAWVAAALAQEPGILLLDEPTQALDIGQAAALMEMLAEKAAAGLRVVAVLHDLNLATLFCDRLVMLDRGQVLADGPPEEVVARENVAEAFGNRVDVVRHPRTLHPILLARRA